MTLIVFTMQGLSDIYTRALDIENIWLETVILLEFVPVPFTIGTLRFKYD
jgi:hypothetical protein